MDSLDKEVAGGAEDVASGIVNVQAVLEDRHVLLDIQVVDVLPQLLAQWFLDLWVVQPAPVAPRHVRLVPQTVTVVDGNEGPGGAAVGAAATPGKEVSSIAVCIHYTDVEESNLLDLVCGDYGGRNVVHCAVGLDEGLEGSELHRCLPHPPPLSLKRRNDGVRPLCSAPARHRVVPAPNVEGPVARLCQRGLRDATEAPVVKQVGGDLTVATGSRDVTGAHGDVGGGEEAARVVGGVGLFVGGLEDGDVLLRGGSEDIGSP